MARGQLRALGSSLRLKQRFGSGYQVPRLLSCQLSKTQLLLLAHAVAFSRGRAPLLATSCHRSTPRSGTHRKGACILPAQRHLLAQSFQRHAYTGTDTAAHKAFPRPETGIAAPFVTHCRPSAGTPPAQVSVSVAARRPAGSVTSNLAGAGSSSASLVGQLFSFHFPQEHLLNKGIPLILRMWQAGLRQCCLGFRKLLTPTGERASKVLPLHKDPSD